jgi:hypothetical protein
MAQSDRTISMHRFGAVQGDEAARGTILAAFQAWGWRADPHLELPQNFGILSSVAAAPGKLDCLYLRNCAMPLPACYRALQQGQCLLRMCAHLLTQTPHCTWL